MKNYDVIIVGAGAAGLSAAIAAASNHKRILIFELGNRPARKVAVSGGGRCNITNKNINHNKYFSENPNFVRGAISRFTTSDVLLWCNKHNLTLLENKNGQYFCANGADAVVQALLHDAHNVDFIFNTKVSNIQKINDGFIVNGFYAKSVIVATGGISFATLGVSDCGYKIAKQFGHKIIPVRPALCAIKVKGCDSGLSGISSNAEITVDKHYLQDSLLLTHFGIGGPLAYRISLYDLSHGFYLNLLPNINISQILKEKKKTAGRKTIASVLSEYLPNKIAKKIAGNSKKNIADVPDKEIEQIANNISNIFLSGDKISLYGLSVAEIVSGGVDTNDVSSKTMESKLCPGLFFAGEVLDVAGDLGGFNLHWAWASGFVAGKNA